ncbi:hypothetical protein AAFF_G00377440 [Aldrovandia affinis]|uniref:Uncharacterized protein n=1 Tax=Aldrovandia affinis TaxID=143900 RepID=A0AAD7WM32_9TELE|nr:hypothetical protein AAFF_G00377440 [Aldrovandia affinis]
MFHYAFWAFFLVLGSGTCLGLAPVPTAHMTDDTTVLPPAPTTTTTPTTEGTNVTTLPPPEPTTEGTNVTTLPPPEPTTEGTNVTTLPPPAPTTPTAAPAPTPVPHPAVGSYNVRSDVNSTACLMATMGLQISYKEGTVLKSVNLDPNTTVATGKCGDNESDASLALTFDKSSVTFTFSEEGGKFRLHAVNVTLNPGATGTAFSAANTNLSLWEASVGSSYLCRKDQSYNITDALTLHTLGLQVQPFGVKNSSYATAHECAMDDTSILIPIVVGAALAGLILIVMVAYVIAEECFLDSDLTFLVPIAVGVALAFLIVLVLISYLIGRRKSRTGYQSV